MAEGEWAASVIAGDPVERDMVVSVLLSVGWRTIDPVERADLILTADIDRDAGRCISRGHARSEAPLIAWSADPASRESLLERGYDDVLPRPCQRDQLIALLDRWRPVDPSSSLQRLGTALGWGELRAITTRFQTQLNDALASLADDPDRAEAHRIAGIAGMLGLSELGAAWLAVAEGRSSSRVPVRIATRLALAALARDHERAAAASGSNVASRSAQTA